MTTPTTRRITSTVLAVLAVLASWVPPSPSSPLTVSNYRIPLSCADFANPTVDSKQARDLVNVLQEAKQQIDPRLAEMTRYGGGGGGRFGGYRGRGGYRSGGGDRG